MSLAASSAGSEDCGVKKESEETERRVKNESEKPCHRVCVKQEPKEDLGDCIYIKKEADGNAIPVDEPPWGQYGLPGCYAGIKVEVKLEPVSEESQPLDSSVRPTSPTLAVGSQAKHEEPNNSVSPELSAGSGGRTSQPTSPLKSTVNSNLNKHSLHSWNAQPVNQVLKTNLEGEQTSVDKKLTCNVCTKQFKRKGDLVKHSRAHSGVRPYSCDICIKQFARNGDLLKHRRTHTGEKPYTCKSCPKQFTRNGDLVIHSRTHTGEKPYSCRTCPKQFTRKSILVQHILTHTGEKPYICKVCSRRFTQKSNLIVHRRIHTGEKPYTCDVCMKQFAHKNGLAVHRQIHNKGLPCSYICDICSNQFIEKKDLVAHLRTHTGEKGCP